MLVRRLGGNDETFFMHLTPRRVHNKFPQSVDVYDTCHRKITHYYL